MTYTARFFHRLARIAGFLIAIVLPVPQVSADTSVWKVSKDDSHIYLGGTMHVLSAQDYPLPPEFDQAYQASDLLVFETDMAVIKDPVFMQKMVQQLSYLDGTTIKDHLKPETITALESHFRQRSLSLDQFASFKPSMLYMLLSVIELQLLGIDVPGVDEHFTNRATTDNKRQLHLESPQEQVEFIATIGEGNADQLFEYTLRDLAQLSTLIDDMRSAWREGDAESLDEQLVDFMQADYPAMYEILLVKRNKRWLPALQKYFSTNEIEFVLVGAAHLIGDEGLLEQLEQAGYSIEQL